LRQLDHFSNFLRSVPAGEDLAGRSGGLKLGISRSRISPARQASRRSAKRAFKIANPSNFKMIAKWSDFGPRLTGAAWADACFAKNAASIVEFRSSFREPLISAHSGPWQDNEK
jgi:hypothetical protein